MSRALQVQATQHLLEFYSMKKKSIRNRLKEFNDITPSEYFYELIYCLLTPQSSAVNASRTIEILKSKDFRAVEINPESILRKKESYIRFHRTKSKHLLAVKENYRLIESELVKKKSGKEHRTWLVDNIKGMGWKEASHFLRNIGYRNLAILDRHILRNLIRLGVLQILPKSLTAEKYLEIEEKFRNFATDIDIPMDELDLLFWCMETGELLK
jgi:N-glycosylase/DNA lyase